jgi:ubiquinone/menaquinone biosynthesis C-methylase UbiE
VKGSGVRRLNFGCGPDVRDGWTNVDCVDRGGHDVANVLNGLPYPDDTFDCAVANHVLNMIRFHDIPATLAELFRVLRPNGALRVLVPNYEWAIANVDRLPISPDVEPTTDGRLLRYLFWHGDAGSCYTPASLAHTLTRAGFTTPVRCRFSETTSTVTGITDVDSRAEESLIIEVVK